MNDNAPPRLEALHRAGFPLPKARLAQASARTGEASRVEGNWGSDIPIANREIEVIETFLGGLLDELLARPLAA